MSEVEQLAKAFHEAYEAFAPNYNYRTREESAVKWGYLPDNHRELMIAAVDEATKALREELKAARAVMTAAKLFSANAAAHILECARAEWGNTNVNCAVNTRSDFEKLYADYLARYPERSQG